MAPPRRRGAKSYRRAAAGHAGEQLEGGVPRAQHGIRQAAEEHHVGTEATGQVSKELQGMLPLPESMATAADLQFLSLFGAPRGWAFAQQLIHVP